MIKGLCIAVLLFGHTHMGIGHDKVTRLSDPVTVYICNSETAKKYHFTKNCRGLNACQHNIKAVDLTVAKNKYKRTLCGWED